jgi:hypothetical protein
MITKLAQFTDIRVALAVGGLSLQVQAATLRTSPEILVATPVSSSAFAATLFVVPCPRTRLSIMPPCCASDAPQLISGMRQTWCKIEPDVAKRLAVAVRASLIFAPPSHLAMVSCSNYVLVCWRL